MPIYQCKRCFKVYFLNSPYFLFQKKKIPFAELNNVKTKFEKYSEQSNEMPTTPKPIRCITPPPEGTNTGEIENHPMQRQDDIVSSDAKYEDKLPDAGHSRSRKELFESIGTEQSSKGGELPRVKSITPPREDALKRVLKETTPERNENVTRESDRSDDILPTAGHIKNTAAMFANGMFIISYHTKIFESEKWSQKQHFSLLLLFNLSLKSYQTIYFLVFFFFGGIGIK